MNKRPSFNLLLTLLILGFILVVIQIAPVHGTPAFPISPLPTPSTFSSPLPLPIPCPSSTNQADLVIDTTVDGLSGQDAAELQLVSDTSQTANCLSARGISLPNLSVRNEGRRITVTNIPDGSYKLIIHAPTNYFREPEGYLFRVSKGQVVRTSSLPFQFKLIPPAVQKLPPCRDYSLSTTAPKQPLLGGQAECMAEHVLDLSGPAKKPILQSQAPNAPAQPGQYYYDHMSDNGTRYGVWGRNYVVDPQVAHLYSVMEHLVWHVYATYNYTQWMEAGWAEVSWRDNRQYIYEYNSTDNIWTFFDSYTLSPGTPVTAIVQNDGGNHWQSKLYSNGSYYNLIGASIGFAGANHSFNGLENYSDQGSITIVPPSYIDEGFLFNGIQWNTWDDYFSSSTSPIADSPFQLQLITHYYQFILSSPTVCLPLIMNNYGS